MNAGNVMNVKMWKCDECENVANVKMKNDETGFTQL